MPHSETESDGDDVPSNVLCIITDQQRQDSIAAYGNEFVETPNLDRLAADGTRFDRAYTPTAICSPARASIVTGVSPTTHGITRNLRAGATIDEDFPCYPQLLREAGYNVGLDGKWHVGKHPRAFGFDGEHYPGFMHPLEHDDYEEYLDEHGFEHWSEGVVEQYPSAESEYVIGGIDTRPVEASFTYFIAERTIERIERYADDSPETPFYIGSHFFGPHRPYFIPEKYFEMYDADDVHLPESAVKERFENKPTVQKHRYDKTDLDNLSVEQWRKIIAIYHGYVSFIDDQVGRILDALERNGLADDTAVVFTTDHGSFVTAHKSLDKGPMMYEDIYNIPLIVRGLDIDGGATNEFASLLDLAPTFLDLAGVSIPDVYEGRSLLDLQRGVDDWREQIVAEFHGLNYPYEQRMLRTDRYKLVLNAGDVSELYDLEEDPHELTNRISAPGYSDVRERLEAEISDILRARDDPELPEDEWLYPALTPMYYPRVDDEE
jgi:arylsulfatase A-like enzyme